MRPRMLVWEDGHKYKIDRVVDVKQAAAMRCGGQGDRYTVVIDGKQTYGNNAQFVGSVGDAFSAICCLQIFRFTSSKPSKSAIASDEKFIRLRTNSFVRYCPISTSSAARI